MTIDEMIAVLNGAKEGKVIQSRAWTSKTWKDCGSHFFNFQELAYRVKPVPRRWWITVGSYPVVACNTRHEAESLYPKQELIEVVEVLE
jgi:hypothetical protein